VAGVLPVVEAAHHRIHDRARQGLERRRQLSLLRRGHRVHGGHVAPQFGDGLHIAVAAANVFEDVVGQPAGQRGGCQRGQDH
jgi:hypothetical protein